MDDEPAPVPAPEVPIAQPDMVWDAKDVNAAIANLNERLLALEEKMAAQKRK